MDFLPIVEGPQMAGQRASAEGLKSTYSVEKLEIGRTANFR
jgi:hypothetical protein